MSGYVVGLTFRRLPVDDHGQLLVALALAEQADSEGNGVFPSVALLAVETRLSRRAVQYRIAELQELGYLVLVERGGGRNRPNRWRIDIDWLGNQSDRVASMRAQKMSNIQVVKNGAPHAPLSAVDNLVVGNSISCTETMQKQCTNRARAGAHNPPTHSPACKPPPTAPGKKAIPPVDELVEAALWQARSGSIPPRRPSAYARTIRVRLGSAGINATADDLRCHQAWLMHLEEQRLLQLLADGGDGAS